MIRDLSFINKNINSKITSIAILFTFLITILLTGKSGLYDYVYFIQILTLVIFYNFKINLKILITNLIIILFVFFFNRSLDSFYLTLVFFTIILSFDITSKHKIIINNYKLFSIFLATCFLLIFLMKPFVNPLDKNHGYNYNLKINNTPLIKTKAESEIYQKYLNNHTFVFNSSNEFSNDVILSFCKKKNDCEKYNLIKLNRYHFNQLDINFSSLVFVIIFLSLANLTAQKSFKLLIISLGFFLIYFFTKSRFLIPCLLSYYFFLFFENRINFKFFIFIFISLLLSYFLFVYFVLSGYILDLVNAKYPIDAPGFFYDFGNKNLLLRIFSIIEPSIYFKFKDLNIILKEIFLNYKNFLLPNKTLVLNNPHSLVLNLIIEYGYIFTFWFLLNLFRNFKNKKFTEISFTLMIGSIFLGAQFIILSNLILIISNLKTTSND